MNESKLPGKLIETSKEQYDARSVYIREIEGRPDKLVRETRLVSGMHEFVKQENIRMAMAAKTLFEAMKTDYGIKVVDIDVVVDNDGRGGISLYVVVDKIEGKNLLEIKKFPDEAKEKLENLYCALARYHMDAWRDKKIYWADCKSDQFVFGHKHGEELDDFYLVDVGHSFMEANGGADHDFAWNLESLCSDLIENEQKFTPPARFEKAREIILGLIDNILVVDPKRVPLLDAKKRLLA